MNYMEDTKRSEIFSVLTAGLVGVSLLAYFCFLTIYSSDDYWYSTFWNDGLSGYLDLMVFHYLTMNGRVIVHVIAHLVLACGNWAFALLCCGCCLLPPFALAHHMGLDRKEGMTATVFFILGILLMPRQIQNQGMLWISASCNYLVPTALICLLVLALEENKKWVWIAAFVCGATTEQMGLVAVFVCSIFLLDAFRQRKGILLCLGSTVMSALGVVTIFLSPATSSRAATGVRMNNLQEFVQALQWAILDEVKLLTENPLPLLLMVINLVLAGNQLRKKTGGRWPYAICCLGCVALAAGGIGTDWLCVAGYVIGFLCLAAMGVGLIVFEARTTGALILAALFSAAVMLVTNSVEARVMLPFVFLMLLCVCLLGSGLIVGRRLAGPCAILGTILTVICLIPVIKGYWYNYQVDQLNKRLIAEAKESGCMRYCTDYDQRYTWIKADHDPYFRIKYLESAGLPENMGVIFFSQADANPHMLYIGDKPTSGGAWTDDQGRVLFPVRQVVESMGGSVDWQDGLTIIRYQQTEYHMKDVDDETVCITWNDDHGQTHQKLFATYIRFDHLKYCESGFFTDILDIPILYDSERFCYSITP